MQLSGVATNQVKAGWQIYEGEEVQRVGVVL